MNWKKKLLSHCHCLLSFSHHPPISAVYVEDTSSRTTYTASIYTKSGMKVGWMPPFLESIFVNNLGQSRINLLEHGEEYLMMLPSAAVESVLRLVFRCEEFLQPTPLRPFFRRRSIRCMFRLNTFFTLRRISNSDHFPLLRINLCHTRGHRRVSHL